MAGPGENVAKPAKEIAPLFSWTTRIFVSNATVGGSLIATTDTVKVFVTESPPGSVALTLILLVPLPLTANASVRFVPLVIVAPTSEVLVFAVTA